MKNLRQALGLLLTGLLLAGLAGCARPAEDPGSSSASGSMPDEPDISVVAPVDPEPEPEPDPYVNPLTGEGTETDLSQNRPVAIMLNNLKKALPQLGVSQADIIYEVVAEGGITRMLGVFQSVEGVGEIGSVRSARDYFVSLALGHDAVFLHAGGSDQAYIFIKSHGVTALDCVNGPYEGSLFWRDPDRRKSMGLEHSVLTSGEAIQELLPTYSRVELEHKAGYDAGLTFLSEGEMVQGDEPARRVEVRFSRYKTGVFTYDEASGLYRIEEFDAPYVDGNTGEQVAVKNVLVLFTDISSIAGDTAGRQSVRTTGAGEGLFFCDGTQQSITWSRPDHDSPMAYLDSQGQPLELGVGHTYVNIVGGPSAVTVSRDTAAQG